MGFICRMMSLKYFINSKLPSLTAPIQIVQYVAVCAMFVAWWWKVYTLDLELVKIHLSCYWTIDFAYFFLNSDLK